MMQTILKYMKSEGIKTEPEKDFADIVFENKEAIHINEAKSYSNSIYIAVGQVQYYKHNFKRKYKELENKEFKMNIIGDFDLPGKFTSYLRELKIQYVNINSLELLTK